jgi:hypothetical protein
MSRRILFAGLLMEVGMEEQGTVLSLSEIARRLDGAGIAWAVFAGAAATVYGSPRSLTDVDILLPAAEGDRAAALFPEAQVIRLEDGAVWVLKLPGVDLVAGLTTADLDAPMAARLTRHEIASVSVPIIPPEDNILIKALWDRGPQEGKHDWEDVVAMMTYLPTLDWDYLRWRATTGLPQPRREQVLRRLEDLWQTLEKE